MYDYHHRLPRSRGGSNQESNVVRVSTKQHIAYHQLFENKTVHEIADILNEIWIEKRLMLVVRPRVKTKRKVYGYHGKSST